MEAPRRWSDKRTLVVLVIMIVGAILMVTWPVWFAPPNLATTQIVYLALMVLWFPVLVILAVGRKGALGPFVMLLVIGVVVAIVALSLGGPNLSAGAYRPEDCKSAEVSAGVTEYTCQISGSLPGSGQTLILQGQTGSPFAHLISHSYQNTP